jgi:hypothetical protein
VKEKKRRKKMASGGSSAEGGWQKTGRGAENLVKAAWSVKATEGGMLSRRARRRMR